MKRFTFLILFLLSLTCYGQTKDTSNSSNRWLQLHFATGVNFISNETLQNTYGTNALFFWGLGARVGNPKTQKLFVQLDYNRSSYQYQEISPIDQESTLAMKQLVPAISFKMLELSSSSIHSKVGYIASFLQDDVNELNQLAAGLKIGLGIETKVFRNHAVHVDFDYDLVKARDAAFKDYDLWKFSLGVYL